MREFFWFVSLWYSRLNLWPVHVYFKVVILLLGPRFHFKPTLGSWIIRLEYIKEHICLPLLRKVNLLGKYFKLLSEIRDKKETFKTKRGGRGKDKCLTACRHTFFQGKKSEMSRLQHFRKVTLGKKKNRFPLETQMTETQHLMDYT